MICSAALPSGAASFKATRDLHVCDRFAFHQQHIDSTASARSAALASPQRESRRPRRASATVVDAAPNVGLRFDPLSVDGHHYSDSVRRSLPHGLPPPLPVGSMVGIGADPLPPTATASEGAATNAT